MAHEHPPGADSHGVPWHGRTLTPQPFAGDAGEPDPRLVEVLVGYAAGRAGLVDLASALAGSRLFVPVVAVADPADSGELLRTVGDSGADMAVLTLTGQDGSRALPVFTGVAALVTWDPGARPVPVEAERAAQAAVAEGCDVIVVDLGGRSAAVVPRSVVWALGQGRAWLPPAEDPEVLAALARAADAVEAVREVRPEPTGTGELHVVLGLARGLDRARLDATTEEVRSRLAVEPAVAERSDALRLVLTAV